MDIHDNRSTLLSSSIVYNVILQLGNPIGIVIGNIIANKKNTVSAFGSALPPGYRAVFYTFAAMAGVGLIVTIVFAPTATQSGPMLHKARTKWLKERSRSTACPHSRRLCDVRGARKIVHSTA